MSINAALSISTAGVTARDTFSFEPLKSKLESFKHCPQPIIIFKPNMELLELNPRAEQAIERHWIGVSGNKLHFNSPENNLQVLKGITRLSRDIECSENEYLRSERFILRNVDMLYRTYTVSRESQHNTNLVLTIQGDLNCSDQKIKALIRAFTLSASESKIVKMMVLGMKPKEIAYEAGISLNTVRSHLRTLYAKMQVRDYNEALALAVRLLV